MLEHDVLQCILLSGRGSSVSGGKVLSLADALQLQCVLRGRAGPPFTIEHHHAVKLEEHCADVLLSSTAGESQQRHEVFEHAASLAQLPPDATFVPAQLDQAFQHIRLPACKDLLLHASAARRASQQACQELNGFLMKQEAAAEKMRAEQRAAAMAAQQLQQQQQQQQQAAAAIARRSAFDPGLCGAPEPNWGPHNQEPGPNASSVHTGREPRWVPPAKRPLPPADEDRADDGTGGQPAEGPRGFQTALQKLGYEQAKKGQPMHGMTGHPRMQGLARPSKRPMMGANPSSKAGGHVPQHVAKALDGPDKPPESQFSEKVVSLLGGPDGQVPPEIEKLDPKIVEMVCNEILDSGSRTEWADIAGLEKAKNLVHEIIVWPMQNPNLFKGARAPPKGLLLFGPPGTGKTLIGRAIACNINATFFSISASSLTSKWIGDGEKMVRALFAVANCFPSSVIFIDEIDSILSARKTEGEHEASRRMKTEMLIQMEGCSPSGEQRVLLVGATNRPEELDEAARRRMPKQLYIPLPCAEARRQMILHQLRDVKADLSEADLDKVVAKTDGYSGSDMRNFIQEACQAPVRDAIASHGSAVQQLVEDDLRPIRLRDFQLASKAQKASVTPEEVNRYLEYDVRHGAKYIEATAELEMEEDW